MARQRYERIKMRVAEHAGRCYGELIDSEGKRNGSRWAFRCPLHNDDRPSLTVYHDGRFHCFGCGAHGDFVDFFGKLRGLDGLEALREAERYLGLEAEMGTTEEGPNGGRSGPHPAHGAAPVGASGPSHNGDECPPLRTTYPIKDHEGKLIASHVRLDQADGTKTFVWLDAEGKTGLGGVHTNELPLYRSERLRPKDEWVWVVEGEKTAEALAKEGVAVVATVGASSCPVRERLAVLDGRDVILWPDDDTPGREHMNRLGLALEDHVRSLTIIATEGETHGDAADVLGAGQTAADILAERGQDFVPAEPEAEQEPQSRGRFVVADLRQLDQVLAETTWLWPRWIPNGYITILAGEPGCGKSATALWLAHCAVSGTVWPDGAENSQPIERVLWLETDDCHGALRDRSRDWSIAREGILLLGKDGLHHIDIGQRGAIRRIKQTVIEEKIGLVVIDTLAGAHGEDENSAAIRTQISALATMARETGAAVLAVHHLRKRGMLGSGEASMDRVRGSSAIVAGARSIIGLDREVRSTSEGASRGRLTNLKANLCDQPAGLTFQYTDHGMAFEPLNEAAGGKVKASLAEAARLMILDALKDGPKSRPQLLVLCAEAGFGPKIVDAAAETLPKYKIGRKRHFVLREQIEKYVPEAQRALMPEWVHRDNGDNGDNDERAA